MALKLFLLVNGCVFMASDAECVIKTLELAAGDITEENLASWIRQNLQEIPQSQ